MKKRGMLYNAICTVPWLMLLYALAYAPLRSPKIEENRGLARVIDVMQNRSLSRLDADAMIEGYYEGLLDEATQNPSTWEALTDLLRIPHRTSPPAWLRLHETDAVDFDAPYLRFRLKPNLQTAYKEAPLITNRWRQRDQDYNLVKPPSTYRIALVGASVSMGSGVPNEATYEALLERALNERHVGQGIERYELINFSVAGYRFTQQLDVVLEQVPAFQVDLIMVVVNDLTVNPYWAKHLISLVRNGEDLKYDFLKEMAARADLRAEERPSVLATKLAPYRDEIMNTCLRRMHACARRIGADLVILRVPQPIPTRVLRDRLTALDETLAELDVPVIDLLDTFAGDLSSYWLRSWDRHPNERGHRLLFENLYRKLEADPRTRRMIFQAGDGTAG
jgi:lysophospholipase L1-like esterase